MKQSIRTLLALLLLAAMLLSSCSAELVPPSSDAEPPLSTEPEASASTTAGGETATEEESESLDAEEQQILMDLSALLTSKLSAEKLAALPIATADMTTDQLRQLCMDYFRLQLTFQWIPNMSVDEYYVTYGSANKTLDFGSVYGGVPYQSTGTGNLYRWMEYYDEVTGIFDLKKAFRENGGDYAIDREYDAHGKLTYQKRRSMMIFFNQCSVASFWGWGRVINSANFAWTADMTIKNGFIPVGGFTYGYEYEGKYYGPNEIDRFGEKTAGNPQKYDTDDVIADWNAKNGASAMYECYAQLKPADLVVSPGHAMMVTEVHVARTATGYLDANSSYVIVQEQIEGWAQKSSLGLNTPYKVQGRVDCKYSFTKLQKSSYIPFTFAEFLEKDDPRLAEYSSSTMDRYKTFAQQVAGKTGVGVEAAEVYSTVEWGSPISFMALGKLVVGSNYPISDVFLNVKDIQGNVVFTNVHRTASARIREVAMTAQHASWDPGRDLCSGVEEYDDGNYRVEVVLQLSTGEKLVAYAGKLTSGS